MIALDTNVLVRYLVEDDPLEQCERAAKLVDEALDEGESIFLSDVVLCEFVWVLESCYRLDREAIADLLERLVHTAHLVFSDPARIERATRAYRDEQGDFADYMIREEALAEGCSSVATFDGTLIGHDGFFAP